MNKIGILIMVVFAFTAMLGNAQKCKVKLEALSGTYEGDCKKGLANGKGIAKGTDTYEGEFKKGLPHGEGVYTWANEDVYEGEFDKGVMNGAGKFIAKSDNEVVTGYWKDGEYIGTEKDPFKVTNRGPDIKSAKAKRLSGDKNQIDVVYQKGGKRISVQRISVVKIEGNFATVLQNGFKKEIQQVNYPFRAKVTGKGNFEFRITQAGHWEITVEIL